MDFVSRISVTCFAASYGIGVASEILRIFWPNRPVRWLATTAALAGLLAQTLFLLSIAASQRRLPIDTQFESLIAVSWMISLVYLYLLLRDRRLAAGIVLLPISLGLVLYAAAVSDRGMPTGVSQAASKQIIAMTHGMMLLLGTAAVALALAFALMYLVKIRQLKTELFPRVRLPSLERLDRLNSVTVFLAWPLLTLGILLGLGLGELRYSDPKVITTAAAWLLFTILAHARYHPENRGRKIATMTIIACLLVLFSVVGDPIFGTLHQASNGGAL